MLQNGIIAIDKPEGLSSAAVVAIVKRKLGVKKVGHTGTLDPFATGLMLCGVNKGTKLSRFFLDSSKHYSAEVALGIETDTQDYTGEIVNICDKFILDSLTNEKIVHTVEKFKGVQMQNPPIYSALKHNGKPLYKLAREGNPIRKPPRKIKIHSIEVVNIENRAKLNSTSKLQYFSEALFLNISVHCSSGTYIRSLAHDIGRELGCGGSLTYLRRTKIGRFSIDDAIKLSTLENISQEDALNRIIPMSKALDFMPVINADDELIEKIRFGRPLELDPSHFKKLLILQEPDIISYFKIVDSTGEVIAIIEYNRLVDKYNYCCVFIN
ncbi:MAG: tRNA pseudouridine(55) synthase TruB [Desulfamplus sp.]